MFPIDDISREEFFSNYWRRRPLFVAGGAKAVSMSFKETEFLESVFRLEAMHPDLVRRAANGLIFAQKLDLADLRLQDLSTRLKPMFCSPELWFDGVLAVDNSSIGFHWDASDNFVLQQSGTKLWCVQPPDDSLKPFYKEAMVGKAVDSSVCGKSAAAIEFTVVEGDLLYIPIFWSHMGISKGPSLSYTLVVNATSSMQLLPLLFWLLSEQTEWWKPMPIPIKPNGDSNNAIDDLLLTRHVDELIGILTDPAIKSEICRSWVANLRSQIGLKPDISHQ